MEKDSPFHGLSRGDKVALAYSGGVDSSVAAFLAKEYGLEVIALTLSLLGEENYNKEKVEGGARALDLPLVKLDHTEEFREKVIRRTWEEYKNGRTPNPCTLCNPLFKFGILMEEAENRSCKALLTGHYARILPSPSGGCELHKGADPAKDQSYFLAGLSRKELSFARFPLGGLLKEEVKEIARSLGLSCANDKESQDVCFAHSETSLGEELRQLFGEPPRKGFFLSMEGRKLGEHKGIHAFTIGQRKGMGIALGAPAYVQSIRQEDNSIVVTTDEKDLFSPGFYMKELSFLLPEEELAKVPPPLTVKIRYRSRECFCRLEKDPEKGWHCLFDSPQRAVTPGQLAVFYKGEKAAASGVIECSE